MPKRKHTKLSPQEEAQSAGCLAVLVGFLISYLAAEITLAARPHPYHWLATFVGTALAGAVAYGLVLRRGTR
jgi:hypothetical protein